MIFYELLIMIYGYQIHYLKYTSNIPVQFYRYLLFYMKPDTMYKVISGITQLPLYRHIHFTYSMCLSVC